VISNLSVHPVVPRVMRALVICGGGVFAWWMSMSSVLAEPGGVRLEEPRIAPDVSRYVQMSRKEGREIQAEDVLNIRATMANHPELSEAWSSFGAYILQASTLPPRDRELVILRIGWLCQAAYEWSHHSIMGLNAGLSEAEVLRVTEGADGPGWSEFDRALIRATDELHGDSFIKDETWEVLRSRYSTQQMMDLVFTVGEYNLVSMALNSFGVQLDRNRYGFPR